MRVLLVSLVGFCFFVVPGIIFSAAHAQQNNKPFSFKGTPDGGVGMSIGGQQAIINKKILGNTSKNLVRSPVTGELLSVTKGPGSNAIVSVPGGNAIPKFKGSSYKGSNPNMTAGVFNAYFSPSSGRSSAASYSYAQRHSSASIDTWTGRAVSGQGISYSGSSLDTWTAAVYALPSSH